MCIIIGTVHQFFIYCLIPLDTWALLLKLLPTQTLQLEPAPPSLPPNPSATAIPPVTTAWTLAGKMASLVAPNNNGFIPVWLWNWLISAGLMLVLSQTEKSCIVLYYIQFSKKCIIIILKPVLSACAFGISGITNLVLLCSFLYFYTRKNVINNYIRYKLYLTLDFHVL